MKKLMIALLIGITMIMGTNEAGATEIYEVIYDEVKNYNQNEKESAWIAMAILYASGEYRVDPILITAVMEAESGFNFKSVSDVGAIGLMQLMPETAESIGVNPYNPLENVVGGTIYLKNQLRNFAGYGEYAVTDAVAAYNAGEQAVMTAGGVPNYSETRQYVVNVANNYNRLIKMVMEYEK